MVAAFALVILAATGCRPGVDRQLAADARLFCRAWDDHGRPTTISSFASELVARIKSPELLEAFAAISAEGDGLDGLRAVIAKAGVHPCPTLDWLEARVRGP